MVTETWFVATVAIFWIPAQEEIYNRRSIMLELPADFQRWHDAGRIPKGNTGLVLTTSAEHPCCASTGL